MATQMRCGYKKTAKLIVKISFCERCGTSNSSKLESPKPTTHDMIGPPDPISNLRPVAFHVPRNEHEIEKEFRVRREEVQKWNKTFWTKHNKSFFKERKEFIAANLPPNESSGTGKQTLTADEMSVFYKTFLDKNWKIHVQYNAEWYWKNIGLVIFALRVKIFKVKQRLMSDSQ